MSQKLSWAFGVLFVGFAAVCSFHPAELALGLFTVDRPFNTVHLFSGLLGVLAGIAGAYQARLYLWTVGLFYLATSVAGFIAGQVLGSPLNAADNYLNLGIAAVALYGVFADDPHLGAWRIPITGRRGVTDFRQPAPRW